MRTLIDILSPSEWVFLLKVTCVLIAFWGMGVVTRRFPIRVRLWGMKAGFVALGLVILFHIIQAVSGHVHMGVFESLRSPSETVVRFSSLEAPDKVPPSVQRFRQWQEGDVWVDPPQQVWWQGKMLLCLVALGLIFRMTKFIVAHRQAVKFLTSTIPAPLSVSQRAASIAKSQGLGRVPDVRMLPTAGVPCCVGFIRPVVLISPEMVHPSRDSDLDMALCHELAHVKSNDLLWMQWIWLLESVLWYLPWSWGMARSYEQVSEFHCDGRVLESSGDPERYGHLLARLALEHMRQELPACSASIVNQSNVLTRIERLKTRAVEHKQRYMSIGLLTFLLWIGIVSMFGFDVRPDHSDRSVSNNHQNTLSQSEEKNLLTRLQANEWKERKDAATLIAGIGQHGSFAHSVLIKMLQDSEWQVRQAAAYALLAAGPRMSDLTAFEQALLDDEWHVRKPAILAIGKIGEISEAGEQVLLELLNDEEWHIRWATVETLKLLSRNDSKWISHLKTVKQDEEVQVNRAVQRFLNTPDI